MHTIVSPIIFYKLYCITTPDYPKCFRYKNYFHIVIFTLDLQRVSFCSVIDFLYHSLTNTLLLPLIPIEGFIRALRPLINMREIVNILMALWRANLHMQDRHAVRYLGSTFLGRSALPGIFYAVIFHLWCLRHKSSVSPCGTSSSVMLDDTANPSSMHVIGFYAKGVSTIREVSVTSRLPMTYQPAVLRSE